jgi:hypothetical protein
MAGDQAGARRRAFANHGLDPMSSQRVGDIVGGDSFVARRIGRIEPDEGAQTIKRFILKRFPRNCHRTPLCQDALLVIKMLQ